ncbi:solute carrier family 2, facilitated glucose transporter member 11-like, partial [Diceros bicornis minor]|uniref:solute carrier family 2, facilitated glucose transporter member 11-like n=1 Tax=Diceros bicornis minor TaxID=77932 RepID=UPI0026F2497A
RASLACVPHPPRKKTLLVNNIFVVAAAVLFGFSRRAGSFEMIMLGRLLMGVSAGVSMNVQPMYLGESAPKELRGAVAITSAIFTALGIVMGQVVGLRELLGGPQAWPLLLASCLVPGVLQLASLPRSLRARATTLLTVETPRPAWQLQSPLQPQRWQRHPSPENFPASLDKGAGQETPGV